MIAGFSLTLLTMHNIFIPQSQYPHSSVSFAKYHFESSTCLLFHDSLRKSSTFRVSQLGMEVYFHWQPFHNTITKYIQTETSPASFFTIPPLLNAAYTQSTRNECFLIYLSLFLSIVSNTTCNSSVIRNDRTTITQHPPAIPYNYKAIHDASMVAVAHILQHQQTLPHRCTEWLLFRFDN